MPPLVLAAALFSLHPKKARYLPRPWPLLRRNQNPDTIEARLAFHLHRLHLHGRPLASLSPTIKRHRAVDIAAGRISLSPDEVRTLARLLHVDPHELIRPLTDAEQLEWFFYSVSATYPSDVWANARNAWQADGLTIRQAAQAMGLNHAYVVRNVDPLNRRPRTLTYPRALNLTSALETPLQPQHFLSNIDHGLTPPLTLINNPDR